MKLLNNNELKNINGGATTISSAIINAFINGIDEIIKAGKICGDAIRRIFTGNMCSL